MSSESRHGRKRIRILIAVSSAILIAVCAGQLLAFAQDKSDFPKGYDAVQVAPNSHKVIFQNSLVRVLEVTMPSAGKIEPMHHHHWPSFFVYWDTGGESPHIRYHRPDGSIRDSPSEAYPVHPGRWTVDWMKPEPMHAIEVVENYDTGKDLPLLRVEIKLPP
jgi:hypothetical protein